MYRLTSRRCCTKTYHLFVGIPSLLPDLYISWHLTHDSYRNVGISQFLNNKERQADTCVETIMRFLNLLWKNWERENLDKMSNVCLFFFTFFNHIHSSCLYTIHTYIHILKVTGRKRIPRCSAYTKLTGPGHASSLASQQTVFCDQCGRRRKHYHSSRLLVRR